MRMKHVWLIDDKVFSITIFARDIVKREMYRSARDITCAFLGQRERGELIERNISPMKYCL